MLTHLALAVLITVGVVFLYLSMDRQSGTYTGRKVYADGVYMGDFKDGKKDGFGRAEFSNGDIYVGQWKNDSIEGSGNYTFGSNSLLNPGGYFVGEFMRGRRQCRGTYAFVTGHIYTGDIKTMDDEQHVYIGPNGEQYMGVWLDSDQEGYGSYNITDQLYIEGEWSDSKLNGYAEFEAPDGSYYKGQWINGTKHGRGEARFHNGHIYNGTWVNGYKHGHGVYIFPDNRVEGQYELDIAVGIHNRTWNNGTQDQTRAHYNGDKFLFVSL